MPSDKYDYIYNVSDDKCRKLSKDKCTNGCVYDFSSDRPECRTMLPIHKRYCRCLSHLLSNNTEEENQNRTYKYNPYAICRSSTKIESDKVIRCKQHYNMKKLKYLSKLSKSKIAKSKRKYDYKKEFKTLNEY
jgi:hypothetical protein